MLTRRCSTTMTDTELKTMNIDEAREEASKVAVNDNDLDQQTKKTCLQKFIVKNPIVFCFIIVLFVFASSFMGGELGSDHWLQAIVNQTLLMTIKQLS